MRILYVTPRQCLPATSGAKLRDYYLARALGEHSELIYIYTADPGVDPLTTADLPFCREVVSVPKDSSYTPSKIIRGFLGRTPLPVLNYSSPLLKQAVAKAVATAKFDLVHLDSVHVAGCLEVLASSSPVLPLVWNWHNIESELMWRFAEHVDSLPKRLYARKTARQLEHMERVMLRTAAGHIVCSERERERLLSIEPRARVALIDNGVDSGRFDRILKKPPVRVLFVGAMNYHANVEGIVGFARDVWPELQKRHPMLRLTIVGADPAPAVLALRELPGVEVTGTVPDVRPYYSEAAVAIVPLMVGAGTRLKILEAMAAGVPVVSSVLGAEGLEVTPGKDILIADGAVTWLRHISEVIGDPYRRDRLIAAARCLVHTRYDWHIIGEKLNALYGEWFTLRAGAVPISTPRMPL